MIPDVSFIIPSCREHDYNNYAGRMVKSITDSNYPFSFEIIVCSKTWPKEGERETIWVKEPDDNNGSVLPINLAYHACQGKYVVQLNDDCILDKSLPNAITFLQSSEYDNKKIKITCLLDDNIRRNGEMAFIPGHPCSHFPYQILRYPVFERETTLKYLGKNFLDSRFKHHDSDMYLTCYIFRKYGEMIKTCENAHIYLQSNHQSNQFNNAEDRATYHSIHNLPVEQLTYE